MTPRNRHAGALRRALSALALLTLGACTAAAPRSAQAPRIPDRAPAHALQALSEPDAGADLDDANAFCLDGAPTLEEYNEDGSFVTEWDCAPGGGIDRIRTEGTSDALGDGSYTQTTFLESGAVRAWLFSFDTSDDFLSTTYVGNTEDGSESYSGVYTFLDGGRTELHEEWSLHEGVYVLDGIVSGEEGERFSGTQSFDDPSTAASPDYRLQQLTADDGSVTQLTFSAGDGWLSESTSVTDLDGNTELVFATDLSDTEVSPDFDGSYAYGADGSGTGAYVQRFDDGSLTQVTDAFRADGSLLQQWSFDDAATALAVDQEGSMEYAVDGSGEGSFTIHAEDGSSETCAVHVDADGSQTIDGCS